MSSPTTEHRPTFDMEAAVLLENLKQKLELDSDWQRAGKRGQIRSYTHGEYHLDLIMELGTERIKELAIRVTPAQIRKSANNPRVIGMTVVTLLECLLQEVDPAVSPDDLLALANILHFSTTQTPFKREMVLREIHCKCVTSLNHGMCISLRKAT